MSLLAKSYHLCPSDGIDQDHPKVVPLSRSVAEELTLLSVLVPFMTCDLSATLDEKLYATDASESKGAYVEKTVPEEVARAMWRTGRKKGGYTRPLSREEALIRKIDLMKEEHLLPYIHSHSSQNRSLPRSPERNGITSSKFVEERVRCQRFSLTVDG